MQIALDHASQRQDEVASLETVQTQTDARYLKGSQRQDEVASLETYILERGVYPTRYLPATG